MKLPQSIGIHIPTATADGGCLLNSQLFDSSAVFPNQKNVILLKLDSLGSITSTEKIENIKISKYLLFPNPSENEFTLAGLINRPITLKFFDVWGNLVFFKKINSNTDQIHTEQLKRGVYFYIICDRDYTESGKWIKE